ncbi:MAG: hypothetical protein ACRENE_25850 [Polyangiaceae bacterium]
MKAPAAPRSEGQRRFATLRGQGRDRTPLKALAIDLGVSVETVRLLLEGRMIPGLRLAVRIEALWQIAPREWLAEPAAQVALENARSPAVSDDGTT